MPNTKTPTDLEPLFHLLRAAMLRRCPPMVVAKDTPDHFEIIGNKPVPYGSRKQIIPGMYFASAVRRKDMISFYFFPIYSEPETYEALAPTLLARLKGKSCFHIKSESDLIEKELDGLLKRGVTQWKKAGYLNDPV